MAKKDRACKICKEIYEDEDKCPHCGSKESTENYKGRVYVVDPEKSEIAEKLNVKREGNFAIKTR